jgi:hypothetical protein
MRWRVHCAGWSLAAVKLISMDEDAPNSSSFHAFSSEWLARISRRIAPATRKDYEHRTEGLRPLRRSVEPAASSYAWCGGRRIKLQRSHLTAPIDASLTSNYVAIRGRLVGGSMNMRNWKSCLPNFSATRYRSSSIVLHALAIPISIQMCSISRLSP